VLLDIALELAKKGLSLMPVCRPGKIPTEQWKRYQFHPPDEKQLREWFGGTRQPNLGIITGWVSRVVVVDTDDAVSELWAQDNLSPTPWMTRTSKGIHRFYRYPPQRIGNKAKLKTESEALNLDIRGDGGYVVGPGSLHESGFVYEFMGDWTGSIDYLPSLDTSFLPKPAQAKPARVAVASSVPAVERARRYLAAIPPAVAGQGGDTKTFYAACRLLLGFNLTESDTYALLSEWNQGCSPKWSEEELLKKIRNAKKYGEEDEGSLL
jgi:hypothetical protein